MNFFTFLSFQKRLFTFVILSLLFVTLFILVLPDTKIPFIFLLYLYLVCLLFLGIYLIIEYILIQKSYRNIQKSWGNGQVNIDENDPVSYEQFLYKELLHQFAVIQQTKVTKEITEKKENLQYMTSWFHDIKTPISVCRLTIENSLKTAELLSIDEELDKIENSVEQALYYVRSDEFHQDYFIEEQELSAIVSKVVKQHSKLFISKKITLDLNVAQTVIISDTKWLIFILSQIIHNSIKYTPTGKSISIYTEQSQLETTLVIKDNGVGIAKEDVNRVFEQGFTGINGRAFGKSTGMGLYLAQSLALKLGHTISIEAKEHAYTKVTIHFPVLHNYYKVNN